MTIERLRELLERLTADPTQVTSEELSAAQDYIREQRGHLSGQDASEDVISALTELRDTRNAIRAVQTERATASAELDEQRRGLLDEIGEDPPAPIVESPADEVAETTDPGAQSPPVDQPVTEPPPAEVAPIAPGTQPALAADARPAPRRAPISAFRAAPVRAPRDMGLTAQTVVTATGGSPNFTQGQLIDSTAALALAMTEKLKAMSAGRASGGDKVYVATARTEYPESRTLKAADWIGNFSKIEQATG
ncbi:MAG: hypothetical protein ACRDTT_31595, partial [Pseudonocardiaceae bacterium]